MQFDFHTLLRHLTCNLRNRLQGLILISGMVFCHLPFFAQSYNIDDVNGETIYLSSSPDGYILLYDSGGPFGNYQDFEDYEVTICSNFYLAGCPPPPIINCTFNYVDIEPESGCGFDWLQMDNGPFYCNENYPPLYGTTAVSYVSNTDGCMTVRFHADLSLTYEGFELLFEADHPNQYDPNPLQCNDQRQGEVYWTIHGCPSCIDYHTCGGDEYGPYWGSEIQYDIDAEGPVTLTVDGDVDFFVYGYATNVGPNGCPPISSIACATGNQQSVSFDASDYPYGIWVIVDGEVANFDISLECNPCDPGPIECGWVIEDFLNTGTDSHDTYDCVGPDYPYQEKVYAFTPENSGYYKFLTYGYTTAAPAIIVSDCCGGGGGIPELVESQCLLCESSWAPNSVLNELEVFLVAGNTYYIFIEKALDPSINRFQFWIDCNTPLDCDPAPPLECGDVISGNNFASSGAVNRCIDYCGHNYDYWTGREVVYSFHADYTGQLTLYLYGLQEDLDLFFLSTCDAGQCLGEHSEPGTDDEILTVDITKGQTYYIVIDGYLGATSTYNLSVECTPEACKDCGDCFTYTLFNKGSYTDLTCIPKYRDCAADDYPSDDHTFQWTVDGIVKSNNYKPTLSIETGRKVKVCQIVRYLNAEQYRCCWDIEPAPGCNKSPVAYVQMEGLWPFDQVTFDAAQSENGKKYFWDFGDGTLLQKGGSNPEVQHSYTYGGYTYCTYVQNDYGISTYCKSFAPGAFECSANSNPQFTYSLTGRNLLIKDVDNSGSGVTSYTIDFGDSTTVLQGGAWGNRSHTFEKDSVYEVCVRYSMLYQETFPCVQEGCVCFTVRVNCCQQTVDNCYELKPVFVSANGGLQYRFEYAVPGIQVLQWEVDDIPVSNASENSVNFQFPQAGFHRICCIYKDPVSGCFIKCCKWIYVGDPFDPAECGAITYSYDPVAFGYRFELHQSQDDVSEIQLTVDEPVQQSLGVNLMSDLLPVPGGACQEYIISVRYFDKNCGCYRLCCLRFYLCSPLECASRIKHFNLGNGKTRFYTDEVYEQMKWFANGTPIGSGAVVEYNVPIAGSSICLYYFDPVSRCHRVCCLDLATATEAIEGLSQAMITPNPATDQLHIILSFQAPVLVRLELVDQLGVVVKSIPEGQVASTNYMHEFDIRDLPAGLYFIRVLTPQGSLTRKIIRL